MSSTSIDLLGCYYLKWGSPITSQDICAIIKEITRHLNLVNLAIKNYVLFARISNKFPNSSLFSTMFRDKRVSSMAQLEIPDAKRTQHLLPSASTVISLYSITTLGYL
jgi:hypothetical protein